MTKKWQLVGHFMPKNDRSVCIILADKKLLGSRETNLE
jgi:hypothetical protein